MFAQNDNARSQTPMKVMPIKNADHRVLVIDDNAIILKAVGQMLQHQGYDVDQALGSGDAKRKIMTTTYDIVLTDFDVSGLDCLFLARLLKKSSPHIKLVMMTVRCEAEFAVHADNPDVDHWMIKPFRLPELISALSG